jgi:hypothetical protein
MTDSVKFILWCEDGLLLLFQKPIPHALYVQ